MKKLKYMIPLRSKVSIYVPNTERGERVICTIGAIFMVLAFASFGLLVAGMLEPKMGLQRAIMLVVAFYVLLWGVCRTIQTND